MAGKVKEVAVEEADRVKSLTRDAVRSGAYLYPLKASRPPSVISRNPDIDPGHCILCLPSRTMEAAYE